MASKPALIIIILLLFHFLRKRAKDLDICQP